MRLVRPILLGLFLVWVPCVAHAGLEDEVKAAYLFKFLSYVEWPASALGGEHAPIVVGVLDADSVQVALRDVASDQEAQGRPVVVRAVQIGESTSGLHVLFVGRRAAAEIPKMSGRQGVLIVSESNGALEKGAMINLVRAGDRIRFEVAPDVAKRCGIHVSSRVLALARFVQTGTR